MSQTRIIYVNHDFDKNKIMNALLNPMSNATRLALVLTADDAGYIAFDLDDQALYCWTGTAWKIAGKQDFLSLNDTPDSYAGQGGNILRVTLSENGIEFHTLTKGDIGLDQVDNTSDINKPVSNATQAALNLKADSTEVIFQHDIPVSLPNGQTLGRYKTGDIIPSTGKTPEQVVNLLAQSPINPTVSLSSSTVILFNQTSINNVLNFSYTINTLGGTVASVLLEWRRNNTGSWIALDTTVTDTTYTHTLTDTAFNTQPFNYRYTVIDSAGASTQVTFNIIPQSYVAPSISFSALASSISSPESNTVREKGNISSILQGSTTQNSSLVPISSYQFAYSLNGGSYINIGSSVSLATNGGAFTTITDNNSSLSVANTITYRVGITDSYTTTYAYYTITFKLMIYYGPSATAPTVSSDVRSLPSRQFYDAGQFILNTGTSYEIFTVAMPYSNSLSQVIDLDALNANITSNYIQNNFSVNDASGTAQNYKNYIMTNAVPYSTNHRHQVTYS